VGEKRAREIVRWLVTHRYLEEVGTYKGKHGYRIRLFRVRRSPRLRSSVGRRPRVKPWWQHPLFGFGSNAYPKELPGHMRKWKSPP